MAASRIHPRSHAFRRRFFPNATGQDWNDWRWQLRNRIRDLEGLERILQLTDEERQAVRRRRGALPVGFTPYYASLLDPVRADQPLRRTMVPTLAEFERAPGEQEDPLGEEAHSPVPGLVHTYPDKALFLVTDFCATYCRYCTRSRLVGAGEFLPDKAQWERCLAYIAARPAIRDVLLSGGDPLILSEDRLEWLIGRLRSIPHVEIIRIGTKIPAVLPQRITPALTRMLRRFHPLWMSLHFTHPDELTPETGRACARLADAGIPLVSQTVLLAGVNDEAAAMKALLVGLLKFRVKPYYLHQCDPVAGSAHFKTPVVRGFEILRSLHGHTTGYAVPHFMIDAPGGGGKIPLAPDYVVDRDAEALRLLNYQGRMYFYPEPAALRTAGDQVTRATGALSRSPRGLV
jgi:lysine 2,3-aminomutase